MKVKRYMGGTIQEAMQKVKMDLGRDAIILSTRKVRKKGFMGFFTRPLIEVVATIDDYVKVTDKTYKKPETIIKTNTQEYNQPNTMIKNMESEFSELKSMINKVYSTIQNDDDKFSELVKNYLNKLRENEVVDEIIYEIKERISADLTLQIQEDENIVRNFIYNILLEFFPKGQGDFENNKKVRIFVGPTGVGKTTTLAKLAATYSLTEKKKVGFITSDTYRIAAVEQLRTYSEIINVPLTVIYSPLEFIDAVKDYKEKDIVMVDTAGRSHKDRYQLMELKPLLNEDIDSQVYLVISATTKMKDCMEIIESYSFLKDYKLLFTKLDETSSYGIILNTTYLTKKHLSYVTIGQNVPEDIEVADINKIINSLLGDRAYERSS